MTDDKITVKLDRQTAEDYLGNFYAPTGAKKRIHSAEAKVKEAVRKVLQQGGSTDG